MSLVGTRLGLIHVCTIERDAAAAAGWGEQSSPDWQIHLSDQPCRFWADTGREDVREGVTVDPVVSLRLLLPLGTDVTERDRIASVTYRGGTVQDGPLDVHAVLSRRDHLELALIKG